MSPLFPHRTCGRNPHNTARLGQAHSSTNTASYDLDSAKINSSELILAVHPHNAGTGQILGIVQYECVRSVAHETMLEAYKHNMQVDGNYS